MPAVMPYYQAAEVHIFIAAQLQQFLRDVEDNLSPRLALFIPPRHGKTNLVEGFLAWTLGQHADYQIIHTSYTAELSNDSSRKIRDLLSEPRYQDIFPNVVPSKQSRSVKRWGIEGRRGVFFSAGVNGPLTGRGANIAVIDDPIKNDLDADSELFRERQRNWYDSTLSSRLMKGGGILLIQTRWHEADLAGYVTLGIGGDGTKPVEKWKVIRLPAIAEENDLLNRPEGAPLWPEQFDLNALANRREGRPIRWWNALYQQRPTAVGGNLIKTTEIKPWDGVVKPNWNIYQGWDLAISLKKTADYTVCATIAVDEEKNIYILNIDRRRSTFNATMDRIGTQAKMFGQMPYGIGIESANFQAAAFQEASRRYILPLKELKPSVDKVTRAQILADRVDMGKVYANKQALWWRTFESEAVSFPAGDHDDQVDALVYAVMLAAGTPAFFTVGNRMGTLDDVSYVQSEQSRLGIFAPKTNAPASLDDVVTPDGKMISPPRNYSVGRKVRLWD